jgi:hypothetical protein
MVGLHFNLNSHYKLKIGLLVFAISIVFLMPFISNEAFANHMSEKMKWQVVFISSHPACSNYHYQMMNRFHAMSGAYLNEYGIENESYPPICLPIEKYPQNYEQHYDLDLFVLIYDRNLGEEILQGNDVGGFYNHFGVDRTSNHVIVFCDCPNFNFSDPIWILTHELSHFALVYLGYDPSIIENLVHANDKSYDECREDWVEGCESVIQKLSTEKFGYEFSVMPIYKPAVGEETYNFEFKPVSDEILEVSKLITLWWGLGQPIDDKGYSKVIRLLGSDDNLYTNFNVIEFNDDPIRDELTWEEHLYGESTFNSTQLNSHVPFDLKSQDELDEEFENKLSELPEWFKKTAIWWANEEISDDEFAQSIHFLKEEGSLDPYFDLRFLFRSK